jgi:hypothetical protein
MLALRVMNWKQMRAKRLEKEIREPGKLLNLKMSRAGLEPATR